MLPNRKLACYLPWQFIGVGTHGDVNVCCYFKGIPGLVYQFGNLNNSSLAEIWNGDGFKKLRAFMLSPEGKNGCPGCMIVKQQTGFFGELAEEGFINKPIKLFANSPPPSHIEITN